MGGGTYAGTIESGRRWPKETPPRNKGTAPKSQEPSRVRNDKIFVTPHYELRTVTTGSSGDMVILAIGDDVLMPPTIAQALQIRFEAVEMPPTEKPPISPKLLAELVGKAAARV